MKPASKTTPTSYSIFSIVHPYVTDEFNFDHLEEKREMEILTKPIHISDTFHVDHGSQIIKREFKENSCCHE